MRKDVREIIEWAVSLGWRFDGAGRGGHFRLSRGESTVFLPATPSDHRSLVNCRAEIRRFSGVANDGPPAGKYRVRKGSGFRANMSAGERRAAGQAEAATAEWRRLDKRLEELRELVAVHGRSTKTDAECVRLALARDRVSERLRAVLKPIPGSNLPVVADLVKEIKNDVSAGY